MKNTNIIVTGSGRSYFALLISALAFTAIAGIILSFFLYNFFDLSSFKKIGTMTELIIYLVGIGISFGSHKKVYINVKDSKFKSTFEIGPIKIGKWNTITNYEYVSIFFDPSKSESEIFEVNLWYDRNKHFELYTRNNFEDALTVAYELSEELNIDLLDATIANEHKWIDKETLKQNNLS